MITTAFAAVWTRMEPKWNRRLQPPWAIPEKQKGPEGPFVNAFRPLEIGAGEGIRTLDPNLGKVMLYP